MEGNKHKLTHRDTVSAAHALRMRGLHDKRHLLVKLHIAGIARIPTFHALRSRWPSVTKLAITAVEDIRI